MGDKVLFAGPFDRTTPATSGARDMLLAVCAIAERVAVAGLTVKAGINVGPVVGAVLGVNRLAFDIFGDAVNVASRVMTSGAASFKKMGGNGRLLHGAIIYVSETFVELVGRDDPDVKDCFDDQLLELEAKGKGRIGARRVVSTPVTALIAACVEPKDEDHCSGATQIEVTSS
jgi:adenylate cyclase